MPEALVAAAMHHLPAKELGAIDQPIDSDVLICSDHLRATEVTTEIVRAIPGLRALDAGHLSNATPIEAFTAVLLQLNVRYKTRVAVKLTGIGEQDAPTSRAEVSGRSATNGDGGAGAPVPVLDEA